MNEETIMISKKEYKKLLRDREFLQTLLDNGIEKWDGYKEAVEEYESEDYDVN